MSAGEPERRYGPTSGTVTGAVGLVACVLVAGVALAGGPSASGVRVALGAAAVAVLVWAYLLRPRVILVDDAATLVLRNPLSTWRLPLETVRVVGVKAVTTVKTDDARYDAVAVGYPLRRLVREASPAPRRRGSEHEPRVTRPDEQAVMTEAILAAADRARLLRVTGPPVSRTYAVVEIALVAAAALAFVATYLV